MTGVEREDTSFTHTLIEMFMVEANEALARTFSSMDVPLLRRIHPEPAFGDLEELRMFARIAKYRLPEEPTRRDLQALLQATAEGESARAIHFAVLRTLSKATYSPALVGHYALASEHYAHFTSPIRRYPDLLVHRLLRRLLQDHPDWGDGRGAFQRKAAGRAVPRQFELTQCRWLAREASERERGADAAERELDEWRKAAFMVERVGEQFNAMIINVQEFGFFVELTEFFIEGLVPVRSLTDDIYRLEPQTHSLIGRHHGQRFRLGESIQVRVDRVNVDRHLIDFSIVRPGVSKQKGAVRRSGRRTSHRS